MRVRPSTQTRKGLRPSHWSYEALLVATVLAVVGSPVAAQQQFAELHKLHLPLDLDSSMAVARGDVDGDGDLDLVIGNGSFSGYEQLSRLYLNNGTGTFTDVTATQMPAILSDTRAVVLGDVDGDGDLDLVMGNAGQSRLYLNNGSGVFTDATATRMPLFPTADPALALGDVDGDGDLDLVVGSGGRGGSSTGLYLNNGSGTFTDVTATRMPVNGVATIAVALGDIDGDGDLDLVCANQPSQYQSGKYTVQRSGQDRVYLNDGTGTFTDATATRMPFDNEYSTSLALGDVDLDGDLDLVFGRHSIGSPPSSGQNRLYRNDGTGTFTDATATRMPVDTDSTASVTLGDVDGDGDLDLVCANRRWGSAKYGHLGSNRLYWNDGAGAFADLTAMRVPLLTSETSVAALADFDGDGDLDLVVGNTAAYGAPNFLFRNEGVGVFSNATATGLPAINESATSMAVGDVDGDGDLDLVIGNSGPGQQSNRLYLNSGAGTFTDATLTRMPIRFDFTNALALGDVDGDGDLDLVIGNGNQQNRVYLNNGAGTFTDVTPTWMSFLLDYTVCLALGDIDGDGDLDLVVGNLQQQNRLYLNSGGRFVDATATRLPAASDRTTCLAFGDVDGDGDLDLVVGNFADSTTPGSGQNRLYVNDGTGTFTDGTATRLPILSDNTSSVVLGDIDGDGDLDLVVGEFASAYSPLGSGQNRLYQNDGTGTFTDATATMPVADAKTTEVLLGDIDGDGDLDLVVGNHYQPTNVYLNLLRQLDTPYFPILGRDYRLDVYARSGPPRLVDVALPYLSLGTASIPLPPFGTVGIDPNTLIPLPAFVVPQPAGVGSVTVAVPNTAALAGIAVYGQALLVQYPTQDRLTNVTADGILHL